MYFFKFNKYLSGIFHVIGTMPVGKDKGQINIRLLSRSLVFSRESRHVKRVLEYKVLVVINYKRNEKYTRELGKDALDSTLARGLHQVSTVELFFGAMVWVSVTQRSIC